MFPRSCRIPILLAALLALAGLPAPAAGRAHAAPEEPLSITADQAEGNKGVTVLTGHVVLTQGTAVITAETGTYDKDHHHQSLQGNVRYVDKTTVITALAADNFDDERRVVLTGGVTVTDTAGTMQGSQAIYYRREGRLVVDGVVHAHDRNRTLLANRLTYWKDTKDALAEGDVRVDDTEEEATLTTPLLRYNRETRVLKSPVPSELRVMDDGKPTVITCDSLYYDSRGHVASAYGHVRLGRDSLAAESGVAVMYRDQKRAVLTVSPRASDSHGATEGDTLDLGWDKKEIRKIVARTHARATYRTQPNANREETSIATGDRITLDLDRQKARRLVVAGSARDEFHGKDLVTFEEDVNTAEGDSIEVLFRDNQAKVANVYSARTGRYQYLPGSKKRSTAEDVSYAADLISYDLAENRVYLRRNARMEYKDLVLNADSVDYDMKRSILVARGNPRLKDTNQNIEGQEMGYDLKNQQGSVQHGRTDYANGFYTGDKIKKLNETVLNVEGGDYTTCTQPEPHYRIHSSEMKIYLHDKVVLKPVVFYVGKLPLLYFPFYVFPIQEGRHSGILFPQFELGLSSTQGRFIRNAGYYWAMNDYMDLSASGDYEQEQPRWTGRIEARYKVRYLLEGDLYASVSRDLGQSSTQWEIRTTHQQEIDDRTNLSISGDFLSDAQYLQDQSLTLTPAQRVSRNLHSLLALTHSWDGGSLNLALDRNQNLAADSTDTTSSILSEQAPTLTVSLSSRPLGRAADASGKGGHWPFLASTYWSYNGRLARQVDETLKHRSDRSALANNLSLSDTRRAFGWLSYGPALSVSHALVDQDALGKKYAQGVVYAGSLNMFTTFYGAFQRDLGPLQGIRHVLTPRISYAFQPEFKGLTYVDTAGIVQSRFPGVAGVSLTATRQSRMNFSIDNTIQLKVKSGEEIKRLDNFANISLSTSHDFLAAEHHVHAWDPVQATMRVYPGQVGAFDASATYDPYHSQGRPISSFSFNTSFSKSGRLFAGAQDTSKARGPSAPAGAAGGRPGGSFDFSTSFSYSGNASLDYLGRSIWTQSQRLNSRLGFQLSPNWHFDYSNQFDLAHGITVYQEITARRDLDCWEATFTRRISPGSSEYYFSIGVKARPEIKWQSGSSGLSGLGGLSSLSGFGGLF